MTPLPNSRDVAASTWGIGRNMQRDLPSLVAQLGVDPQAASGGGDLNGSAATPLFGKSGVNATQTQCIRTPRSGAGNYCGTV